MVDVVDRATRSRMMSGIRGRDTKPELVVRKYLHASGLRFRLAPKQLSGKPDIVLSRYRTAIFVHGCFWHRHPNCKYATVPSTNTSFWMEKFAGNVLRDRRVQRELREEGWQVLVVWECKCSVRKLEALRMKVLKNLSEDEN